MTPATPIRADADISRADLIDLVQMAERRFDALKAELKASQDKLEQVQELHSYTVELSHQMVWSAGPDGHLLTAGRRFFELMAVDPAMCPHEAWESLLHPDDRETIEAAWEEAGRLKGPHMTEFRMRRPDGSWGDFRARTAPRLTETGDILCWYGVTEDITEAKRADSARREAESRLRESEERHRYTLELVDLIIWTTAADGSDVRVGPRFYELTGLPVGALPRQAVHPDDKAIGVQAWERSIRDGVAHDHEFRLVMRDGTARYFRARAAARRDATGQVIRWYGTFEDVHERKLAERASAEMEERYRLAARATNDAIWDLDVVNDQIWWSDSASRLLGLGEHGLTTELAFWERRLHPEDRARLSASFEKAVAGSRSHWSGSYRVRREDGSYAEVADRCFIIRDTEGRAVRAVGAMLDLTERRLAQAEIQRIQSELIHVSRLSAMGALASTLAHELNQPLTAVTGYIRGSRRLLDDAEGDKAVQVRGALDAAEAGALRAGQIVRRLREMVARGNVTVRPEDLSTLIEEASELALVDAHLHGVAYRIEVDPAALWVQADRIQAQQVLINLIRNAVQAMADSPRRELLLTAAQSSDSMIEVQVSDTGPGIAAERMEQLFSPFNSSKAEGLGIGLSISRTIVEAHGGRIWAENRPEEGALFHFTLPRADPPGA
jgi:two-component system sensor kinase FixL